MWKIPPCFTASVLLGLLPACSAQACGICGSLGMPNFVVHELSAEVMDGVGRSTADRGQDGWGGLTYGGTATANLGAFGINIIEGGGLQANPQATAAFQRAAATWGTFIADPITININANLQDFANPDTIGSTSAVVLQAGYDDLRDALVFAGAGDALVEALPTLAEFSAWLPNGFSLAPVLLVTKANAKAMEVFGDLDGAFGASDATITFNSQFAFDYDRSDGISPGTMDFETVALHEIGHALGFLSIVDSVDVQVTNNTPDAIAPFVFDLFRFENGGGFDPSTLQEFTTMPRLLAPGGNSIFDTLAKEWALSTGYFNGDGRQASHWIDGPPNLQSIGAMDPTLSFGQTFEVTYADIRVLDLLGYNIVVPEPSSVSLLILAAMAGLVRRRRSYRD